VELLVVSGSSFRVSQDVPGIVEDHHLLRVAPEVRMVPPRERAVGASDRGRIRVLFDTENGVEGRQVACPGRSGFGSDMPARSC
jgi:hypothetical protein